MIVYVLVMFVFQILTNAQLRTEAVPTLVTTLLVHSHVPVQPGSHWILVKEAVKVRFNKYML